MIEVHVYERGAPGERTADLDAARSILAGDRGFVWLDVGDPTDDDLAALQRTFGLHSVTLEDVRHRRQRPKVELFDTYAFVVARPVGLDANDELDEGELHAVVGRRFLGTIRYGAATWSLDGARARWERQPETLDELGGGFALYLMLDEIVDEYLTTIERFEDRADILENDVFGDPPNDGGTALQERIFRLKRDVVRLRRSVSPLRPAIDLLQEDPELARPPLLPYLRDLTEHVLRVSELADNIRDLLTSLLEVRVAQVANHMNDIMKRLSAWAGIILVPTLIAGIYGMNFRNMPELGWGLGYPAALALMSAAAGTLYVVFKRRDWL